MPDHVLASAPQDTGLGVDATGDRAVNSHGQADALRQSSAPWSGVASGAQPWAPQDAASASALASALADGHDLTAPDEFESIAVVDGQTLTATVPLAEAGARFDQVAVACFAQFSREKIKKWLLDGHLQADGRSVRPKDRCRGGEQLRLQVQPEVCTQAMPEAMALDIVFADDQVLVVNKPAGLVVHPGAGNWTGTLVNGLLHHEPALAQLPRAGLVHRIDKDTSGLLVVARTLEAQVSLSRQLLNKSVYRIYEAVCVGDVLAGGTVSAPIRRHPVDRLRMAVQAGGREAVTHYRVQARFGQHTLLRLQLETGRTHQIRVHMAHLGKPLVGDPLYGGRARLPAGASQALQHTLKNFCRQALHARQLGFVHPTTGENVLFEATRPADFAQLVEALRHG